VRVNTRFYRYVTGPVSLAEYPAPPGGTFRRAVALAEEAVLLADGLPNVARGVLIAAALLHEVGKADDFRVAADGSGVTLSERGRWVGYQHTLLEWLGVARTKSIVPDALYLLLVHVLIAFHRPPESPQTIETAILKVARGFVDSPERVRNADRLIACASPSLH
jgi:3'-5' exoribonuclease